MKLKDALGKPGEGIHFHICGIAVMDVLATVLVGCLLGHYLFLYYRWASMIGWTLALFVLGEILHLLIGVDTTVVKWLRGMNR